MKILYWKTLGDTVDSASTEAKFDFYVHWMNTYTETWRKRMVEPARWSKTAYSAHISIRSVKEVLYMLQQEFRLRGQKA